MADGDFKKAARNKVLDDKIGISGKCNTEKAVRSKVVSHADDVLPGEIKELNRQVTDTKNTVTETVTELRQIPDTVKTGKNDKK